MKTVELYQALYWSFRTVALDCMQQHLAGASQTASALHQTPKVIHSNHQWRDSAVRLQAETQYSHWWQNKAYWRSSMWLTGSLNGDFELSSSGSFGVNLEVCCLLHSQAFGLQATPLGSAQAGVARCGEAHTVQGVRERELQQMHLNPVMHWTQFIMSIMNYVSIHFKKRRFNNLFTY